ncbi:hypothetical protein H9I45_06665 [Polaribacter haliotis]|uniref:Uncharacterized protein n=1 Tax=Polaribacter haliotis TaxID=1888915 RepID=A0A7L8AJD3_9FLAO|nr:hypothetical protein [Polaribacter haliotis]QOD62118.1 hypothetical protein H9I45_06665 [Polaribacter haliotis]
MLLYKLRDIETSLEKEPLKNKDLLEAIVSLKSIFLKLNFEVEEVPEYSFTKILKLLESIKNSTLTKNEELILRCIIKKK